MFLCLFIKLLKVHFIPLHFKEALTFYGSFFSKFLRINLKLQEAIGLYYIYGEMYKDLRSREKFQ